MSGKGVFLLLLVVAAVSAEFECPSNEDLPEGIYPDPDDCRSFYQCIYDQAGNATPIKGSCDPILLFDENFLVCNYPEVVDCGDRPIIDGSTSPDTSTMSTTVPTTTVTTDQTTTTQITITTSQTTDVTSASTTTVTTTTSTTTIATTYPATPTTTTLGGGQHIQRYPEKVMGFYLPLADDVEEGFETDADWEPSLYPYQQEAANVLFFTFINPSTMVVPAAFEKLAATRGTGAEGAVPADTIILFAIGGYGYSMDVNPWPWLTTQSEAENMAERVATWISEFGIDGIDLDIEEGAGNQAAAGPNMGYFIKRLREIEPDVIIGQPSYGYPMVEAANDVINLSWNIGATTNNYADSVGIMVYEGAQSLEYVENFAHGSQQWEGFPIAVDVPYEAILLGCQGGSANEPILEMANEVVRQDLLGIMVWFASVKNGLVYDDFWDASQSLDSQTSYMQARIIMNTGRK